MDIKPSLNTVLPQLNMRPEFGLGQLKLGQLLEARVVDTQILLNTLSLQVFDKTYQFQTDQFLNLQSGQNLQLQVIKLTPQMEFKAAPLLLASQASNPISPQSEPLTLKLIGQPALPQSTTSPISLLNRLNPGALLQTSIVSIDNKQLTLKILNPPNIQTNPLSPSSVTSEGVLITLDRKQLLIEKANIQTNNTDTIDKADKALRIGMQLSLKVSQAGTSPVFQILSADIDAETKIKDTFKQLLPQQPSPPLLIDSLRQLLRQLPVEASVADSLKVLARQILLNLPTPTQLTDAKQIRYHFEHSGLFLEKSLAEVIAGKTPQNLQEDFKFKLSKLLDLIQYELAARPEHEATKEVDLLKDSQQKTQGVLARLTLDQLNSLPKDDALKHSWTLELPFFHIQADDSVKLQIELDQHHAEADTGKNWAVSITITPPELATIHCRVSCYDGTINTRFWSEAIDTVNTINAHLDHLKKQLESKGLISGFMQADQGMPTQTDKPQTVAALLSEKA